MLIMLTDEVAIDPRDVVEVTGGNNKVIRVRTSDDKVFVIDQRFNTVESVVDKINHALKYA